MFQLRRSAVIVSAAIRLEQSEDAFCYLFCKKRWYGISNLSVLRSPWPAEQVVVGECLQARCFTDYDTERLHTVIETSGYARISKLVEDVFMSRG